MCTVTFSTRRRGYALAMNRDEKLTRPPGLPPARQTINGRTVVAPAEPGGGTWFAVNDSGVTFALINWYAIPAQVAGPPVSRGIVIQTVGAFSTSAAVTRALAALPLEKINPFRLIGIFPGAQEVMQWQWNLRDLAQQQHPWQTQQWISSGWDEAAAQRVRSQTFQQARLQKSAGSLAWLRRLHRSHAPEAGPFSTCMHRADAATVSSTEVAVSSQRATLRHANGTPCLRPPPFVFHLPVKP
jgi:hypothetical protein